MDTLAKADIFFFVTTLAIVILTLVGLVILAYVWKIVRNIKDISEHAKTEAVEIIDGVHSVKSKLKRLFKRRKKIAKNNK
jgi:uncharacterized membrane protein